MKQEDENWQIAVFLSAIAAGILLLLVLLMIDWPRSWNEWGAGLQSPSQVLASIVTPIGAVIAVAGFAWNVRNSNRTQALALQTLQSTRFQKGVEMLSETSETVRVGGIALLLDVARQSPDYYCESAQRALSAFVFESNVELRKRVLADEAPIGVEYSKESTFFAVAEAGSLQGPRRNGPSQLIINGAVFYNIRKLHVVFKDTILRNAAFVKVHFSDCTFDNVAIHGRVKDNLRFTRCKFINVHLSLFEIGKTDYLPNERIIFDECAGQEGIAYNEASMFAPENGRIPG